MAAAEAWARPVLASTLLGQEQDGKPEREGREQEEDEEEEAGTAGRAPAAPVEPPPAEPSTLAPSLLPTGCPAIDRVLNGGLRYGEITAIAGSEVQSRAVIALQFISSHLLNYGLSEVVVIDSTGSFSAAALRDVLAARLSSSTASDRAEHEEYAHERTDDATADQPTAGHLEAAASYLDRVKIARIFDHVGLSETIADVAQINDSISGGPKTPSAEPYAVSPHATEAEGEVYGSKAPGTIDGPPQKIDLIVVDDLGGIFSQMMSRRNVEAQALLAALLRQLRHLTQAHRMCAILMNNIVGAGPAASNRSNEDRKPGDNQDSASIFSSFLGRPALGRALAHTVDNGLMISKISEERGEAELATPSGGPARSQTWSTAQVLEVLKDRSGSSAGQFAAFRIVGAVGLEACVA